MRARLPAGTSDANAQLTGLGSQSLVLTASGMGMLMAAATTQSIIERFHPAAVINYGCAGAHRMELLLGDIVVGTRVVAYDSVRETSSGESVYRGMIYMRDGVQQRVSAIACAPHLVKAARSAGHVHDPWPVDLGWPAGVAHRTPHITLGTVASADRWNRAPATIAHLVATHQSLCEDMEAAAIGIVCAAHDVPFLTIKDISNNELLRQTASGTAMLTELGTSQIARRAAACTFATLEVLFS